MKILIFGTGVIGSLLIHNLCASHQEVTVVARGIRKEALAKDGLSIKMGNKKYTDHPKIISSVDEESYDAIFSVMQNQEQLSVLDNLAKANAKRIVFVGNNMTAPFIEESLKFQNVAEEKIFFAFQTSGGKRQKDYTEVVSFGKTELTIGHLHQLPKEEDQKFFKSLFPTTVKLSFMDDMDGWYKCHMAFILPIAYLSYAHDCNLKKCSLQDMKNYMKAGSEMYDLFKCLGILIRPKGDEKNTKGIRLSLMAFIM